MSNKEVTVIIPSYKPGPYIDKLFKSLSLQILDKSKFNVLVVLNGPKQPYYSRVLKACQSANIDFNIIYTQTPGVSNARNIGLDNAKSQYIAFIDDDDWVSSHYLYDLLKTSNTSSLIISNVISVNDNITQSDYLTKLFHNLKEKQRVSFWNRQSLSSCCGKLIPANIIGNTRFDTSLSLGEDSVFMFNISKNIKYVIKSSPETIYYRNLRAGSASRKKASIKHINKRLKVINKLTSIYLSSPFSYNPLIYSSRIVATIQHILRLR